MNKAIEIAEYVIKKYNKMKIEITNLRLQSLLFLLQKEFIKKNGKELFSMKFQLGVMDLLLKMFIMISVVLVLFHFGFLKNLKNLKKLIKKLKFLLMIL